MGEALPLEHPKRQAYIDWLLTPPADRDPRRMEDLADNLGVTRRTLTNWKTRDKTFIEEWERRYLATIGSPERKQAIMDTLYRTAIDQDDPKHVQAAQRYMEIEGSLKPVKQQIEITKSAATLTDEELEELLVKKVASQKKAS